MILKGKKELLTMQSEVQERIAKQDRDAQLEMIRLYVADGTKPAEVWKLPLCLRRPLQSVLGALPTPLQHSCGYQPVTDPAALPCGRACSSSLTAQRYPARNMTCVGVYDDFEDWHFVWQGLGAVA
jgi:hypothetical protein